MDTIADAIVEAESFGEKRRKRRSWTLEEKRRIVDQSLADGALMAEIARLHDLNANQLFTWRRQFGAEPDASSDVAPILPVTIAIPVRGDESGPRKVGQMEIVLAEGDRIIAWVVCTPFDWHPAG